MISGLSSNRPIAVLHPWHRIARTLLVLWSWSTQADPRFPDPLINGAIGISQIAHFSFWAWIISMYCSTVMPNLYFNLQFRLRKFFFSPLASNLLLVDALSCAHTRSRFFSRNLFLSSDQHSRHGCLNLREYFDLLSGKNPSLSFSCLQPRQVIRLVSAIFDIPHRWWLDGPVGC